MTELSHSLSASEDDGLSLLSEFLEATPDAIVIIDQTRRFIGVSSAAQQILGDSSPPRLLRSSEWLDRVPSPVRALFRAHSIGDATQGRFLLQRSDGSKRTIQYSVCSMGEKYQFYLLRDVTAYEAAVERLNLFESMSLGSITDPFAVFDREWRFLFVNESWAQNMKVARERLLGKNLWDFLPENMRGALYENLTLALREDRLVKFEQPGYFTGRWFETNVYPHPEGVTVYSTDITSRKEAEKALIASEERLRFALEAVEEGVWEWDIVGDTLQISPSWLRMIGYIPSQFPGNADFFWHIVHPADKEEAERRLFSVLHGASNRFSIEMRVRHAGGHYIWLLTRGQVVERDSSGEPLRMVGTNLDITRRKAMEEALWWRANHDSLTGLPNREWLRDRITNEISDGNAPVIRDESDRTRCALLLIDLDGFKYINDTLGHDAGDRILQIVATRLEVALEAEREAGLVLARLGGDEFVVWVSNLPYPLESTLSRTAHLTDLLLQSIKPSIRIDTPSGERRELMVQASMGIALCPGDGDDMDSLLKSADTALYQAKEERRGQYRFHSPERSQAVANRLLLETRLVQAVKNQQMMVWYQPQVDIITGQITGVEALLRWNDDELGMVPPALFIPVAEEIGLIQTLGEWVLKSACHRLATWRRAAHPDLRMCVNLSALQIVEAGMSRTVLQVLEETSLPGEALELELTETVLFRTRDKGTTRFLQEMREYGVRLAIDDFGTGYSSLAYLRGLPVDVVKVDREFMLDLAENTETQAIVRAIIDLAHALRLTVTAEGVENQAQQDILRQLACDTVQGYLFSRPVRAEEMEILLQTPTWLPEFPSTNHH